MESQGNPTETADVNIVVTELNRALSGKSESTKTIGSKARAFSEFTRSRLMDEQLWENRHN